MLVATAINWHLNSRRQDFLKVVSSVVATRLLDGGLTAHAALNIPIRATAKSTYNINTNSQLAHKLGKTHLIFFGEIVMNHGHNLKAVYVTFRDLRRSALAFGKIIMLCHRIFRQFFLSFERLAELRLYIFKGSRLNLLFKYLYVQWKRSL